MFRNVTKKRSKKELGLPVVSGIDTVCRGSWPDFFTSCCKNRFFLFSGPDIVCLPALGLHVVCRGLLLYVEVQA